ncbi:MAG: carboxypeptidase regulatory-like domain-containing protein, partial [Acidobacteriaceae bacterium]|nr:carboxypeptidase regulatory-like domain-containing protein [Acidobacteriaceae bacterium]
MRTQNRKRAWIVLSILVCAASAAWAQLNTGSIAGTVKDPSGAVVPGAKVTVTDTGKHFTYTSVTDSNGIYSVRSLPPSTYTVRVDAPGFAPLERPNVVLEVSANINIDASLQVATTGETVTVSEAGSSQLQTEDAAVGETVNRTYVNNLPLITRGVFDLAYLAPGVSEAPGQAYGNNGNSVNNNFVSDGSRNAQSDILLDGISTTNYDQNSGWVDPLYTPSVEAIQEFRVQQTNFSAEYGFTGGTVINAVTRSGTNQYHGELYDFIRNNDFNANGFFNNKNGVGTPSYHQNDFGFTFGGPIKKDKIFFFGDYEGTYVVSPTSETLGLPDAAERTGNFGELCTRAGGTFNSAGVCSNLAGQIYDPYSNLVQVNGQAYR